ncbi:MAG: hypothetical protein V3T83_20540 [Acidobacteriota bacterium]
MRARSRYSVELEDGLGEQGEDEWQRLQANLKERRPSWLTFLYSASLRSAEVMRHRLQAALKEEGKSLHLLRAGSPNELAQLPAAVARPSRNGRGGLCWIEVSGSEAAQSDSGFWLFSWQDFLSSLQDSCPLARQCFPDGLIISALPRIQAQLHEFAPDLSSANLLVLEPLPTWVRPSGQDEPKRLQVKPPLHESAHPQQAPTIATSSRVEAKPPKSAEKASQGQQLLEQARQLFLQKQYPEARLACRQALAAFEASSESQGQARAHYWLARVQRAAANPALALHHVQLALESRDESLKAERVRWYDLAAQMHLQAGDARQALNCCREGASLAGRLAQAHPEAAAIQRDLAVILSRQAEAHLKAADADSALGCYQQSLQIRRRLMRKSPTAQTMRDLSYALYVLGQLRLRRGELEAAHKLTEESLYVDRKIIERFGATRSTVRDYAASLYLTAGILDRLGRKEPAKIRRRQAEQLEKRLSEQIKPRRSQRG